MNKSVKRKLLKHRIAMFISMLAILIVIGVSWRLKKNLRTDSDRGLNK